MPSSCVRESWVVPPGLESFITVFPALKRWAKLFRPSGAGLRESEFLSSLRRGMLRPKRRRGKPRLYGNSSSNARFRVTPEEAVWLPLRAMAVIGDIDQQGSDDLFVFRGGGEVYRLVHVVGGRVIALGQPVFEDLLLGRAGLGSYAHDHRGHTVADEVVLIAADEKIAQRLGVGLNFYAERLRDLAYAITQIGVFESKYGEKLQGHDGQKHVDVDVGDNGFWCDRGMSGEVLRSEQTLFFAGDEDQQD